MSLQSVLNGASKRQPGAPKDLSKMIPTGQRHPSDRLLGPIKDRGEPSGIVLKAGKIRGRYGDCESPEVTFSVSKSYLSALTGTAIRYGLIEDIHQPVCELVNDGGFDSEHNQRITWQHLLHQTSEWEGELFGMPDWIDRGRTLSAAGGGRVGDTATATVTSFRASEAPGTFFEYNDVRVNRLALALLHVFEEPLPTILKREIMNPIRASETWEWHGYDTSWVKLKGSHVQSVSGGAHWGGGLWISTMDHLRFGQLYLNEGVLAGVRILPTQWIKDSVAPSPCNANYGYLWWLNQNKELSDLADEGAFAARGAGGNIIFIWPSEETVIVLRWCDNPKVVIDSILQVI